MWRRLHTLKGVWIQIFRRSTNSPTKLHQDIILICYCRVKNKFCPFRNFHSGKIWRHHLQDQYQMVCVIRASNPSIQSISIIILVFKDSRDSLHHHKYKCNSSHGEWTRYTPMILSSIYLGQMQTAVTINSRHYFLAKTTWPNLHLKNNPNIGGCGLFLCQWTLYFHLFECLV